MCFGVKAWHPDIFCSQSCLAVCTAAGAPKSGAFALSILFLSAVLVMLQEQDRLEMCNLLDRSKAANRRLVPMSTPVTGTHVVGLPAHRLQDVAGSSCVHAARACTAVAPSFHALFCTSCACSNAHHDIDAVVTNTAG